MEIESRSYSPGSIFRPKPYVLARPESGLLILTTSWTTQDEAERVAQMILEHVEQSQGEDATSVGDPEALSIEARSKLKSSLHLAAQFIYKQDNLKQARLLVEALVIQRQDRMISWAQVGQPNLYLLRKGKVAPLAVQADLSILGPQLPPLPTAGLGLTATTHIQTGAARVVPGDQLLFLAQGFEASWPQWSDAPSFQDVSTSLIESQPDHAFWCGLGAVEP